MKVLYGKGKLQIDLRNQVIPCIEYGQVLVKVKACGLCGTDLHLCSDWTGDYVPLGHEIAGEIIELSRDVVEYNVGDHVIVEDVSFCGMCSSCKDGRPDQCRENISLNGQGGMSEYIAVDKRLLNRFDGMDFVSASLAEPCAVAINAVLNAQIPLGGNVIVFGPGPIGLMCVRIAKLMGASKVALIGTTKKKKREAARLCIGEEMGADIIIEALEVDPVQAIKGCFIRGADSIVVTSPPQTILDAVQMVRFGGTISYAGINFGGRNKIEIDVNEMIFNKINLKPTFAEPALKFPTAINLIGNKMIDSTKIISHTFTFNEAEHIIKSNFNDADDIIKAVLLPES